MQRAKPVDGLAETGREGRVFLKKPLPHGFS
jgi:hypothetical protein